MTDDPRPGLTSQQLKTLREAFKEYEDSALALRGAVEVFLAKRIIRPLDEVEARESLIAAVQEFDKHAHFYRQKINL